MAIRILLVDDHTVPREGLRAMLRPEQGIEVVGEVENGNQAVQMAKQLHPDVIFMDIAAVFAQSSEGNAAD